MLKQLMLRKKINSARAALEEYLKADNFEKRSADLETAITEAETDEEIAAVEDEIKQLDEEKTSFEEKKSTLEEEVKKLEGELDELNSKEPAGNSEDGQARSKTNVVQTRGGKSNMDVRQKFYAGMQRSQVDELLQRDEVKDFLLRTREFIGQKRAVTGAELTIPDVMLELLRDNLHQYSKLIPKVFLKPVSGKARQTVLGTIPEGVWTEAVGALNALSFGFNQVEVDGYKVGGFVAIPNATIEDSDLDLSNEILYVISQAIGLAIDKAILYGTGAKMPVGIIKRLAETAKPAYYGANETWTDLHTSNLLLIDAAAATDVAFFKDLILKLGVVKANYTTGGKFWAMSSKTLANLQAKALTFNAAGAIVSMQNNTMPVIGGDVVELDFIPENVIVGGYGSLYLLAERKGATLAQSEHAKFIEDNTVFKGTARYDGRPVFGEAFVALNISQEDLEAAPTATAVTFATDSANA